MEHLHDKAKQIKLALFDVDGVLTTGNLVYGPNGIEYKEFHAHDGQGMKFLLQSGVAIGIITACTSPIIAKRMHDLGITDVHEKISYKIPVYENLLAKYNLDRQQAAYMGDDIPDYPLLESSGLAVCPSNAHIIIKNICDWTIDIQGGNGAVRRLCDAVILAQYGLETLINQHKT